MNEFGRLPVDGVGFGTGQGRRGRRRRGLVGDLGGCRPGIACNKISSFKRGQICLFKMCTSITEPGGQWLNILSGISTGGDF